MTFFQPGQQAYCQAVGTSKTALNVIYHRDPTPDDVLYNIGAFWQNTTLEKLWYLNSFTSTGGVLQAQWVLISVSSLLVSLSGSNTPAEAVYPTSSSASPLPDNIELTNLDGSMTITSDAANNQIIFTATPSSIPWTNVSIPFTASVNNGYFCEAALTATLPLGAVRGQVIYIAVDTTGTVIVRPPAGEIIRLGNTATSPGGTAVSTSIGGSLQLVYQDTNAEWFAVNSSVSWILS